MDLKELFGNQDCEEYSIVGSVIRNPCSLCGKAHFAKTQENSSMFPKDFKPTDAQKAVIKSWTRPFATTSAMCTQCNHMYSSGYLKVCSADPTQFCFKNEPIFTLPEPSGFTDEELKWYFGIERKDLDS